jgi:SAM-dependent methyltransferase
MLTLSPFRHWFRERALEAAVRRFVAELRAPQVSRFWRPRRSRPSTSPDPSIHPFDLQYHVDTSGLVYADKLSTGHAHDAASEGYYATAPSLFHGAIAFWQATVGESLGPLAPQSLGDYTFIDLGCGKGRVLMMATDYPFQKVTGVELSPKLAKVARRNLANWLNTPRACHNVTLQVGDVMQLRLPDTPVVLFLFNSFGAEVMSKLLEALAAAARQRSTPIDLIYLHPDQEAQLRHSGFDPLSDQEIPLTEEDSAADAFAVTHDRCAIYRLRVRGQ